MQRGRLMHGYRFTERNDDLLTEFEDGGKPVGSDAAKQAVLNVQERLAEKKRQPLTVRRGRFANKTGFGESA